MYDTVMRVSLFMVLVACGRPPPSPTSPSPSPEPDPAPQATGPADPAPAPKPVTDANPTVLDAGQKQRDAARVPLVASLVDAFYNDSPRFTPDGKRVLFSSNRGGLPQLYLGDVGKPDGAPLAITHGTERAGGAIVSRDGKSIVFQRDAGADENWALYRVGIDGKGEVNLTPDGTYNRTLPYEPANKPGTLFYSQSQVKSPAAELVMLPLAGGAPKVIYTDPAPTFLIETTADGKRALMIRWNSASDLVVIEVDTPSGKARRVFPAEGKKVAVNDARYSPDGTTMYIASDDGAEGNFVYAFDLAGKTLATYRQSDPATAFVQTLQVSPRGDRIAILINAGNRSEARVLDKRLAVVSKVKTPLGSLEIMPFSADGSRFGISVSAFEAPPEAYTVNPTTGALAALRKDARKGVDSLAPVTSSIETVKAHDGLSLPINQFLPKLDGTKRPVIVSFHGGPSWSYQVRWNPAARFFTSLGYVYLEPNVRGSTGFGRAFEMADDREKRADWLKDLETVNAWVKAQPWADPSRVVVSGGSYGGYTVLMALTRQPKLWRAGVNLFGVADLFTFLKSTDQAIRVGFIDEFGDLDKDKALLMQFSPMRDVDKIIAPLFVYAGANDPRVPRSESDLIVKALRTRNIPIEYMVSANEGHSLDRRENRIEFMTRMARFLEDHVK